MNKGLLACLAAAVSFTIVYLGDPAAFSNSLSLFVLSLLAIRFVIAPAHLGLGAYLLFHQVFFTVLRMGTTAGLPLVVGSVTYLALRRPILVPCRQGRDERQARLLLLTILGTQLALALTLWLWSWDHVGQFNRDPLAWLGLLGCALVVTRVLQPGALQLLLAPVLAMGAEMCCGGLGLALLLVTLPGGLLLTAAVARGWRLDATTAAGCLPLLALTPWTPLWLLVVAAFLVLRYAWALSQGLAESEELWAEARHLGLPAPPSLPKASVRAARVVVRVLDGLSPLAWLLDITAPLWRRLNGPGPSF